MLEMEGLSSQSPLKQVVAQVSIAHQELIQSNHGGAAFIHIDRDCLN